MTGVTNLLSELKEEITSFVTNIVLAFKNAMVTVFVPSDDYLSEKLEYLSQKFGFVATIVGIVKTMWVDVGMGELIPPVVTINLGNSTSKYFYGGECVVLDLSWYAPYKPVTDIFLRAVLWSFFLWRLFVSLPNIINGIAGTSDNMQMYDLSDGVRLSAKGRRRRGGK